LTAVRDLRALLKAAGVPPAYVLAGASYGGLNTQYFARTHPDEVAGIVLIDSIHPDLDEQIVALGLEEEQARNRGISANREGVQYADMLDSDDMVRQAPPIRAIPMFVPRHGIDWNTDTDFDHPGAEDLWVRLQTDLASQAPCSRMLAVPGTSHRVHQGRPDVVAAVIVTTWKAVKARGSPCRRPAEVPVTEGG
jgi:pimeloyl-ACP methyl ester carboxylesterase